MIKNTMKCNLNYCRPQKKNISHSLALLKKIRLNIQTDIIKKIKVSNTRKFHR